MTDGLTDVHVSVVNTDNRSLLERCLASLPAACEGIAWRATVVDNASTDGSAAMVAEQFPWASLLVNAHRAGFSANHNRVIQPLIDSRQARYVLILNEDTELEQSCVKELVERADRELHPGAVGPRIRGRGGENEPSFFAFPSVVADTWGTLLPGRGPRIPSSAAGWLNGSCVLVSIDALAEIGDLDERFFIFFEDTDLGRRLADAGRSSILCEEAAIVHLGHQTVSRGGQMEQQMLRSRYLYFRKHHSRFEAELVAALTRGALGLRAAKAFVAGLAWRDGDEQRLGQLLMRLALYSPRRPLKHERAAAESS